MFSYLNRGKAFYQDLIRLSVPIILQNLVIHSLGLVDTFMVGRLPGETPMAAVTLANIPIFVVQLMIFGLQSGASVLISQFWGKRDTDSINRVVGIGIYSAAGITLPFALVMFFFPMQFMSLFSNNRALVSVAADYAGLAGASYLFNSLSQVYIGAQRCMENPKVGLYISIVSVCSNTFLNWVLIFGKLGAPAMGVMGAALATLLSRILELIITVIYAGGNRSLPIRPSLLLRPGGVLLRGYARYASPVVLNEMLWGLGTSLYPTIMGHMEQSTEILTAFTIAGNIDRVSTVAVFAMANSAAIIVGREIGAGRENRVYDIGVALNTVSLASGFFMGIVMIGATFLVIAPYVYPLFGISARSGEISTMMQVMTQCLLFLRAFNSTNVVGVLRGGGDVHTATMIDLVPLWAVSIPASALCGLILRLDIFWVFLCISFESILKFFWGMFRFRSRAWINNVTHLVGETNSCKT